ncbi:CDP-alcohol phosphatidyltransferase family protein [bacterium]|nr:CDP-alcohol phosphatidyltransferase family protein [bacterium]
MSNRRPLTSRDSSWARVLAATLAGTGVTPDAISILSVVFAALSGLAFYRYGQSNAESSVWAISAALLVQLRLLCNLLDGMVAIEHQKKSKTGDVFNEVPDRIADLLILVGAGYAVTTVTWGAELGWAAACFAVLTAYVRALGSSLGLPARFYGPMAKPHRMATLTVATLLAVGEHAYRGTSHFIFVGLVVITVGSAYTSLRRTLKIMKELEAR